jgi:hypothetical protein
MACTLALRGETSEMDYLNNSDHMVNFSVAVNERWKNRDGESQERTSWLRIVALNGIWFHARRTPYEGGWRLC